MMNLSFFDAFNIIGSFFILGASFYWFIFTREKSATSNIYASFLFILSVAIIHGQLLEHKLLNPLIVIEGLLYFLPPLFYLYITSFINNARVLTTKDLRHFLFPALIIIIYLSLGVYYNKVERIWFETLSYTNTLYTIMDLLLNIQFAIYIGFSVDKLRQYKFWLEDHYSTTEQIGIIWLNRFVLGILSIFLLHLALFGIDMSFFAIEYPDYVYKLFDFLVVGLTIWATLYALRTPAIFKPELPYYKTNNFIPVNKEVTNASQIEGLTAMDSSQSKQRSTKRQPSVTVQENSPAELTEYLAKLNEVMCNKKPYLDPQLGLNDLAKSVGLTQKKLSQLLNKTLNQSFYNYVNRYRIEEVKSRLSNNENRAAKLEGIAIDSGFRSTSTFNRLFKQHTQMTPQEFRNNQLKQYQEV
ncbi:helix-turn-helix domain-containing protein [Aliikangiella sp. IMCC44359]|uniref:helix-turn-helix domain-containing protein n=1 Tax=Aliikangiella sp. IMCC44359 TaxID=3459125 RepID=UPI00403AE978